LSGETIRLRPGTRRAEMNYIHLDKLASVSPAEHERHWRRAGALNGQPFAGRSMINRRRRWTF
jgi:hypothetical protein